MKLHTKGIKNQVSLYANDNRVENGNTGGKSLFIKELRSDFSFVFK
ncbi:hypothetical protein EPK97_13435 [Chengkuizengella sediminis]|nr:hypothetical protein [Chengkuizengella sediminis]